ncbi:hypothetical protein DYB28_011067 [Aphanomyces astaci]|uniref:Tubulin--tyrosine ligase-like protein 9 n=1 Tax=Aphanomyces astaci TaxID=112090 RepID=A0A9X8DZX5_APHAT|nr:hypothetical protein DYB28_011067 [Aphanomyces astaci]
MLKKSLQRYAAMGDKMKACFDIAPETFILPNEYIPFAFFYNEGFVRICTHRYNTDSEDMNDLFMHLTNSSIQKHGHMDQVSDNPVNNAEATEAGGTKARYDFLGFSPYPGSILDVIVKSLVAGEDSIPFQVNSFDLYGYDILLDESFRPWLIEINSSPSMGRDNSLDYVIKDALIYDTMRLVRPLHFDRAALLSILNRRAHDLAQEKKRPNQLPPTEVEARALQQLNEDLTDILHGERPRQYGEMPQHMGNFQRIAPNKTRLFDFIIELSV